MNASEVYAKTIEQIDEQWGVTNAQGCEMKRSMVHPPTRCRVEDLFNVEAAAEMWLVLAPSEEDGDHVIVYSEVTNEYGLALRSFRKGLVHYAFIGFYGSFWDAFLSM